MDSHWSIPIRQLVDKCNADMTQVVRVATFNLFQSVINLSPVDTGRFRANWNMSYQEPDFGTSDTNDEGRGLQEAAKALTFSIGDVAYLCNGLPYAQRLEYGWSQQAPGGMVRISGADFKAYLKEAIANNR